MELILAVVIVLGVIAFIAYPLFNASPEEGTETPVALDGLLSQRDAAYDAIRDLDFDFQMGKLSQSDYSMLRERYRGRAAVALEQIDETSRVSVSAVAEEQEEQIAKLRAAKRAVPAADDAIEREIARRRASKGAAAGLRCAKCETPYKAGDTFCRKCGNSLAAKQVIP